MNLNVNSNAVSCVSWFWRHLRYKNYELLQSTKSGYGRWPWRAYTALKCWSLSGTFLYVDSAGQQAYLASEVAKPDGKVRFVFISDTHMFHDHIWLPDGDVLIHAGDILAEWANTASDLAHALQWFGRQTHAQKIFIGGNHDVCLTQLSAEHIQSMCSRSVRYLSPDSPSLTVARGIHLHGLPWSLAGKALSCNRAFQILDKDSRWHSIPCQTDLLITHGPPSGILDGRGGSIALRDAVDRYPPKVHAFGHEHDDHGVLFENGTVFVNAALCNHFFCPTNRPIVVDL